MGSAGQIDGVGRLRFRPIFEDISPSINGDLIAVGAREDSRLAPGAGAAYIFRRDGPRWIEEAKLSAPAPRKSQQFGWSVAVNDGRVLVGAVSDEANGIDSGSAYLFSRVGTSWKLESRFFPKDPQAQQRFGYAVALDGPNAVVGAYRDNSGGFESGAAYVFENDGNHWSAGSKLTADDRRASQYFGWSVAVDRPTVVVGAWYDGDGTRGSARLGLCLSPKSGAGWAQEKKLIASERTPMHLFGWAVGVSGQTIAIGARLDDQAAAQAGAVYLYNKYQPVSQTDGIR